MLVEVVVVEALAPPPLPVVLATVELPPALGLLVEPPWLELPPMLVDSPVDTPPVPPESLPAPPPMPAEPVVPLVELVLVELSESLVVVLLELLVLEVLAVLLLAELVLAVLLLTLASLVEPLAVGPPPPPLPPPPSARGGTSSTAVAQPIMASTASHSMRANLVTECGSSNMGLPQVLLARRARRAAKASWGSRTTSHMTSHW